MKYHRLKVHMEKKIAIAFLLMIYSLVSEAQSLTAIATSTGQTTGHIASLSITNTTGSTINLNPQTCYIPSAGKYQPYVANIPATSVPPGTSSIHIEGYCANVYARPVPNENPLPPVSDWIPVIQPGIQIPKGGVSILTMPPVAAFTSEDIPGLIKSAGYTPYSAKPSTPITTTWPNTNTPLEGTISPASHPKLFAPVLVEALLSIAKAFDQLEVAGDIHTPFSAEPVKEREAIIQQTFWIYTARITGLPYLKEQFREKVIKQFEDNTNTKVKSLSKEEMEKLENGIDAFWNTFTNVRIEAKVLNSTKIEAGSALTTNTILPPWDKIELTDERMKAGYPYVKAGGNFPLIPVIGGAAGVGALVYFAASGKDENHPVDDCTFTASATPTGTTCGLSNGSISLQVIPSSSYTYQWSNGAVTSFLSNIPSGNYSVTISRTGTTCIQIVQATVTNTDQNFGATISSTNAACDQANGSASVTTSPPGNYTYAWSNGATTQNISNLSAGNYSVTITAGVSCQRILSTQVGIAPFNPSVSFTTTPSSCGESNGSATISVNPPGSYSYAWSNGQSGTTLSGVKAGAYSVTISKAGTSCSHVSNVTVDNIGASFTVSTSSTNTGCGLSNGTANAIVDPPGTYDFIWSNGQTGPQLSGLAAGSYTVTVSISGTNCKKEASVTITETPASFEISLSSTQASCGVSDGTATATVTPPGNYTYTWSNGQSGSQVTGLAPGNYSVTIALQGTDCSKQGSITVASTPFPHEISISTTPASCGGTDGTVTATVTPPGEFIYQWSNGQSGSQLSGVGAGTYSVTVTISGTNCSKTVSATVEELPAAFTASISTTPAGCGLSNGTATVTVTPSGNYNYIWSNGQTGSQLSNVMAGAYTVTVSITGTSCSQIASTTVPQLPPAFSLSFTSAPSGCGLTNGSAAVMVNPPGAYTYQWSNGSTGTQITNVGSGTYTVTVTITGSSCSSTGSVNVGQTGGGYTATFTTDNASCGVMNGSATVNVSPPASYTYVWSNQQTGATISQVGPGTYSVTVSDSEQCAETFSVTIGQDAAEYINILGTTPATCIGGGNISFVVVTPGPGPLNVEVVGPSGTNTFTVGPGVYQLSAFMTVLPGSYTLTVFDQQIGPMCSETVMATVADITPPIELDNDFYTAQGSQPLNENALDNDAGYNIHMTQVDNENGGSVTFMPNGDFVFTADIGFSGEATFVYTVTDACGNTSTAIVTINVEEVPCDIDVNFNSTPATCGLEDGVITANISPPGDYEYEWSNGESGPTIEDVPPGEYDLTITNLNLGCTYETSVELEGVPGNYVENVQVIQPTCEEDGDITFMAISPGGNTLSMHVDHPFGSGDFDIEEGLVHLSDYVTTVPGDYFIEVSDPNAGLGCFESFTATLEPPPLPVIDVVEIFPPSTPTSNDGSAFVEVTEPGQFSYAIYLDGIFAFIINQNNFFLINLSPGVHSVYLVDITGCQSNTEEFFVPTQEPIISFGIGITDAGSYTSSYEQPSIAHPGKVYRTALFGTYQFDVGRMQQEVRVTYAPSLKLLSGEGVRGFFAMEYLSGPNDFHWNGLILRAQAGLGTYVEQHDPGLQPTALPFYGLIRASVEKTICKRMFFSGSVSARGLYNIAPISWEVGYRYIIRR